MEQSVSVQTEERIPSFSTKAANKARVSASLRTEVQTQYEEYADLVIGRADLTRESELTRDTDVDGLRLYQKVYLPQELLHWGGDLRDMFPDTYRILRDWAIDVRDFVGFWFARPRMPAMQYDFFLLKIECFVEFVAVVMPEAGALVSREAMELRAAYESANGPTQCEEMAE
jgi:hypothetical protein